MERKVVTLYHNCFFLLVLPQNPGGTSNDRILRDMFCFETIRIPKKTHSSVGPCSRKAVGPSFR